MKSTMLGLSGLAGIRRLLLHAIDGPMPRVVVASAARAALPMNCRLFMNPQLKIARYPWM
jgi:hypothetical protein